MKIAVDARELRHQPTGVGRFLSEILAAWNDMPDARRHDVILLRPDTAGGTFWEQRQLPRLVRDAGADVLFAPGYSGPLRCPVPMVVAIHDVSFFAHPEWFSWREGARRRTTVRLSARAAARVLTISRFSKREIVAHLELDADKVVIAYPGVTAHAPSPGRDEAARTARGPVLSVGSIFNRRHVPALIAGFGLLAATHPDLRLEIVGDNRTRPRVDLDALVRATGLAGRVHLRSYIAESELRTLYADAAAFVFLSEYEGFGLTPLEALAAGLPVLLLDTPVARETCGDAAVYVARPDPASIAQALEGLLFDPQVRGRHLAAAGEVLARYSWADCARRVLDVLVESAAR